MIKQEEIFFNEIICSSKMILNPLSSRHCQHSEALLYRYKINVRNKNNLIQI